MGTVFFEILLDTILKYLKQFLSFEVGFALVFFFNVLLRGRGRAARRGRRPPDLVGPSFKSFIHMFFSCHLCASAPDTDIGNMFLQRSCWIPF